jgi:hypothetical protein
MAAKASRRLCAFCGAPLPKGAYSNAKYCSGPGRSNCRDKAFRARLAYAGVVQRWATMPTQFDGSVGDRLSCESAFLAELNASQSGSQHWQGRLALIRERAPEAVAALGAVLVEAAVRPLPAGQCRHCLALQLAGGPESEGPVVDRASTALLGRPCQHCLDRSMRRLAAGVAASVTPARSTTTAARRKPPNATDPRTHRGCVKCFEGAAAKQSIQEGAVPSTNPVMRDYVSRAAGWHVETHAKELVGGFGLTSDGRLRVTRRVTA